MTMRRTLAIVVAAVLVSACGHSTPQPTGSPTTQSQGRQFANWPATLDGFSFHWTAEPGIDLLAGPGVLLRAYLESYQVAEYTFDIKDVYPGFLRATPPNADRNVAGTLIQHIGVRPLGYYNTKTPQDARPHYGFLALHVLEVNPLDGGYDALVCTAEYASFIESAVRPGKYISLGTDDKTGQPLNPGPTSGVFVYRIQFTQHDPRVGLTPPQPPTAPQEGPAPAPSDDVFGDWFVTAESTGSWGPIGQPEKPLFPTPELQQRCANAMPQNEAERTAMMTGYKDAPPAPGNPEPGWPQPSK